jgi:hypothetical protein
MNNQSFSYLNPKCESRAHVEGGCGVFANAFIAKGELVSLWGGRIVCKDELDPSMPRFTQRVLQMDEDLYLLTAEEQIGLVTLRDIQAGEELMFDYAMSDGSPYDEFECYCGSANCRKKITGNDWKLPELWERYKGYFSPYLARRIELLRANTQK